MDGTAQEDLLNIDELQLQHTYGKFWSRFWALLLDGLILAVLTPLAFYNITSWKSSILLIAILCIQIIYKPFFEYVYGATPGKMGLKLKVVNYQYDKASLNEILSRNIFHISGGLINAALALYNFFLLGSLKGSTLLNNSFTNDAALVAIYARGTILIIYLIDMVFLLRSTDGRSLHDRIAKTYVIKV